MAAKMPTAEKSVMNNESHIYLSPTSREQRLRDRRGQTLARQLAVAWSPRLLSGLSAGHRPCWIDSPSLVRF